MEPQTHNTGILSNFSKIARRSGRWVQEGMITPEQRAAILTFEGAASGRLMVRSLTGLGLFAVALGILSVVAANWVYIPATAKILLHLLLNISAGVIVFRNHAPERFWWREGALALFFGLNPTLIVLIGQVFQLEGNPAVALGVWMFLSTPALFVHARSTMNALFWTCGALATLGISALEIGDRLSDFWAFLLYLALGLYVPLALVCAGANPRLAMIRHNFSLTMGRIGLVLLALAASTSALLWRADFGQEFMSLLPGTMAFTHAYLMMATLCLTGSAALLAYGWSAGYFTTRSNENTGFLFVLVSLLTMIMPFLLMSGDVPVLGAVHFIGYWMFVAWIGMRMQADALIRTAVWFITIRLIVVYLELFGGLLMTGFGLIAGGVLLLLTLRAAVMVQRRLFLVQARNR